MIRLEERATDPGAESDERREALFGYRLESELPLTRCRTSPTAQGTVSIRVAAEDLLATEGELVSWDDQDGAQFALATSGRRVLVWCSLTGAYAIDGSAGCVWVQPAGEQEHWEHRLTATVLPLLMAERGDLALHASAVLGPGGAVLFCGERGAGKSTLAAALALRGHRVLAEDGVVVSDLGGVPTVWPGPDGVRISRAALASLRAGASRVDPATPGSQLRKPAAGSRLGKATQLMTGRPAEPAPVRAVALLGPRQGPVPAVRRLSGVAGLPALVPNAIFRGRDGLGAAMAACGRLLSAVPIFEATVPDDLPKAGENAEALLATLTRAWQLI